MIRSTSLFGTFDMATDAADLCSQEMGERYVRGASLNF
jgi:hypothetical protein